MGRDVDSYIAWDGQRYFGDPPKGWFLAVDNRWWPSNELIDDTGRATEATAGPQPSRSSGPPPQLTRTGPDPAPPPPGPKSGGQGPIGTSSATRRTPASTGHQQTASTRNRTRKKRRVPPMLMIFIGFVVLRNAGGAINAIGDSFNRPIVDAVEDARLDDEPSQVETVEAGAEEPPLAPDSPSAPDSDTTGSNSPLPTFDNGDFELRVTGCGPGVLTAMMTNTGTTPTAFDVTVDVATSTEPTARTATLTRTVDVLEPGAAVPLMMPLPETMADRTCTVRALTTTAIS